MNEEMNSELLKASLGIAARWLSEGILHDKGSSLTKFVRMAQIIALAVPFFDPISILLKMVSENLDSLSFLSNLRSIPFRSHISALPSIEFRNTECIAISCTKVSAATLWPGATSLMGEGMGTRISSISPKKFFFRNFL